MEINQDKYEKSELNRWLTLFPGMLAQKLQYADSVMLNRVKKHLVKIFYYWYFLKLPHEEGTPSNLFEYVKKTEKWPINGNFFITPTLSFVGQDLNISCQVDYLSFPEQPLFQDINSRLSDRNNHSFSLGDKWYFERLENIISILAKQNIPAITNNSPSLKIFWKALFYSTLGQWWEEDLAIQQSFSVNKWEDYWQYFIIKAEEDWFGIDELIDKLVSRVKKKFPEWGLYSHEMKQISQKVHHPVPEKGTKQHIRELSTVVLGTNLDKYFLTPLSQGLFLIEPFYVDQDAYNLNLQEIIEYDYEDPLSLYVPSSAFKLTDFGRYFFKKIL